MDRSQSWVAPAERPVLLSAPEEGQRNRRTIDAVAAVCAAPVVGFAALVADSDRQTDEEVAEALVTVAGWAPALWRTALLGALVLVVAIAVELSLQRRWALGRDVLAAVLLVAAGGILLRRLVGHDPFVDEPGFWAPMGFPDLRVGCLAAALAVAAPELVRPVRVLAAWLVALAALGVVVLEAARPSDALGGLALGPGGAALVRLAFGTAAGMPPADQVRAALAALGVEVRDMAVGGATARRGGGVRRP